VIGTSTAEFEVASFSNFRFNNANLSNQGQPSSGAFSSNVSCAAIADVAGRTSTSRRCPRAASRPEPSGPGLPPAARSPLDKTSGVEFSRFAAATLALGESVAWPR
jgi:hypothetical protein